MVDAIGRIIFLSHFGGKILGLDPLKARGALFFKKLAGAALPIILDSVAFVDGAAILYLAP